MVGFHCMCEDTVQYRFDTHACIQDAHLKNIKLWKNWLIAPKIYM